MAHFPPELVAHSSLEWVAHLHRNTHLAHEIGHLLLADNNHSRRGVLRAVWGNEDFRTIACGRLWFTPEQAAQMVSLVTERANAAQSMAEFRQQAPVQAGGL